MADGAGIQIAAPLPWISTRIFHALTRECSRSAEKIILWHFPRTGWVAFLGGRGQREVRVRAS